jgi:hypothetical protein
MKWRSEYTYPENGAKRDVKSFALFPRSKKIMDGNVETTTTVWLSFITLNQEFKYNTNYCLPENQKLHGKWTTIGWEEN